MAKDKVTSDQLVALAQRISASGGVPCAPEAEQVRLLRHNIVTVGAALVEAVDGATAALVDLKRAVQRASDR